MTRQSDIVAFLRRSEPRLCPECLRRLMLESTDLDRQEVRVLSFTARLYYADLFLVHLQRTRKALEDYPRKMDIEINGTRPLDYMIPKSLILTDHPASKMRSHAVAFLSHRVPIVCQLVQIDAFIACLWVKYGSFIKLTCKYIHICM